jgi:hypothetical protein
VCAQVGNQRSRGVVTTRVRTDTVRSFHHQRRDLQQLTYPVPLGRSGLILLSLLLSTTRFARVQPTLCPYSPPLAMNSSNTIREKNEMLCMRFKIKLLHKAYKQVFKQLCPSSCQDMQNKSESSQRDHNRITSK